ncbi:hypothetical protein F4859DRAFT_116440 [Xylaria cf. heliscus]|nr:hypothetical protein F4859DRAFT_116440 [Xylaria cf. heliscus]
MDPLSITTAVITLLGAANNVYSCLQSIRHADRGLQSLVKEVSTLNGFLRSIEGALEDCRDNPYALTHIDPALWKESKIALSDCQETLDQLGSVFSEPKRPSRSNTLFRRARVAAELHSRAGEIASFREKISMSNMSLQTLLQVINVSLSLRSNESHDNILRELKELKDALKKSSQAATVSYSTLFLNEKDTRLVHHLKGLVRAAQDFHSSASVTASTVVGSGESQPPPTDFGDDDARSGIASRLPSMKREQIETYLSRNQPVSRTGTSASNREKDETSPGPLKSAEVNLETRETGSSNTFSTIFTSGFSKIAQRALQQLDLEKAAGLLREALKWHSSSGSDDTCHHRRLQTQLALCSLLQGSCEEAQDLILSLLSSSAEGDTVASQLLYALTLLQLHELDFEGARDNSKRLWEVLQRMPHCTVLGTNDAMKLLATSYQESGDSLLADAIEAELPDLRLFEPVPKMTDFLANCEELLIGILGLQDCSEPPTPLLVVSRIHDLPIAKKPSSLQMRGLLLENVRSPISECSPSEVDVCLSVKPSSDFANAQPKAKKRSWSNLRAIFRPRLWDMGSMDLYPLHTGAQDSTFKLKKMVRTSHVVQASPQEPDNNGNASSDSVIQSQTISKSSTSTRAGSVVQNHDPESTSRTMEWVIEQTDNNAIDTKTDTTTDREDIHEPSQRLQRQFSFQAGISDHISAKRLTTTAPACYEMPDNAVFELMDTSPRVKLPIWTLESHAHDRRPNNKIETISFHKVARLINHFDKGCSPYSSLYDLSTPIRDDCLPSNLPEESAVCHGSMTMAPATPLETENDIYDLLGYGKGSLASANLPSHTDVAMGDSSSGSESDISSVFDQTTPSTRQTSFNTLAEGVDSDGSIDEDWPPRSVRRIKSQRDPEFMICDDSPTRPSFKSTDNYGLDVDLDESPSPLRTHESINDVSQPQNLTTNTHGHREFGPAIARLCRYRSPQKTAFRRRLPGGAATGLGRLFQAQDRKDNFDFGFNNALYSGPDAVAGPFTDLEEVDLSGGQSICKSGPRNTSTSSDSSRSVKLYPQHMVNDRGASVGETHEPAANTDEPPPYHNERQFGNRKRSWTRTQIDDFFGVSLERPLFQPIACS